MTATSNDYTLYVDGPTYYAKDLVTGNTLSNASFSSLIAALNTALGAAGGRVYIRGGTYNLDAQITITHPIDFLGAGRGKAILLRTTAVNGTTIQFNTPGVNISGLTIDGNYPTQNINQFAELAFGTGAGGILVNDIEIRNFKTRGINNSNNGAGPVVISNCVIGPSTSSLAAALFSGVNTNTIVDSCNISGLLGGGPFFGGRGIISKCVLANNTGTAAGGDVAATTDGTYLGVFDCIIGPGPGTIDDSGIELGPTNTPTTYECIGNVIFSKNGAGITSDPGATAPVIAVGNVIFNMGKSGIKMQGTGQSHFLIAKNICYNNQACGVDISTSAGAPIGVDSYTVKDNILYGNVLAQWQDMGTGTHKKIKDNIVL